MSFLGRIIALGLSICSFDTTVSPAKTDRDAVLDVDWGGPKEPCITRVPALYTESGNSHF